MRGFVCANDGNLSARLSESTVISTPAGVSKGFMAKEMLIITDLDGNVIIEGERKPKLLQYNIRRYYAGDEPGSINSESLVRFKPSSELKMHLAIYKQSPEIISVCHAHPPISSTFAAAGVALDKAFLQETAVSLGVIPVAKYAMPGSVELADAAAAFCRDYHGVLLEHHGPVAWGESVMQALFRMESIEYAATIAMYSKILGFNRTMSKEQIDECITLRPGLGITAALGEFPNTQ